MFFNVNAFVYFSAINDQGIFLINKEKTFVELKFTAVRDGSLLVITKSHAISDYKEQDYIGYMPIVIIVTTFILRFFRLYFHAGKCNQK